MNRDRAAAILNSPENIHVTYKNIPVWIDDLAGNEAARIRDLNSDLAMEVPLNELNEIDSEQ